MNVRFRPERMTIAPEFPHSEWLHEQEIRLSALRGQPVIVYFWDYASLASLVFLREIRRLEQRYAGHNLAFIGVHTPLFSFERERHQVERTAQELRFAHPTLLDNQHAAARAFHIPVVPVAYLINHKGMIVGQSGYGMPAFERHLQKTLRDLDPSASLPLLDQPASEQSDPGIQELFTGAQRGALGNPEGYSLHAPILYRLPEQRRAGHFYIQGAWQAGEEQLTYVGQTEGVIHMPYEAAEIYAVFSPHHELVERMLNPEVMSVEVWQDDRPLADEQRGDDVSTTGNIMIDHPRVYHLVRNRRQEAHELMLRIRSSGFSVYVFSFLGTSA